MHNNYEEAKKMARHLSEAARNPPLFQALGLQGPHLATALAEAQSQLEETYSQLKEFALSEQPGEPEEPPQEAVAVLQGQHLRYQQLFELNPDGSLITDKSGNIVEASHAAAALLRTRKEFLLNKPLACFVAKAQRQFYSFLNRLVHETITRGHWEGLLQPPRGEPVYVDVAVAAIPSWEGRILGFFWLLRDATQRKRAEQVLSAEKEFADSLIETAQAIILVLDEQGQILRSNGFLHAISGFSREDVLGQDWCRLFLAEADWDAGQNMLAQAAALGNSKGQTLQLVTKQGDRRMVAWSAKALGQADSEYATLLLLGHDITELHEAQDKALRMERLAAIGQAVTELTHESRNAMQRGQACLEILKLRLHDQPEELELLARIQRAQDDLLRLYEDVRTYGAPIHIERRRCNLATIWREAWKQVTVQFPAKEAGLREEIAAPDLYCLADPFRLVQVFRNLLENAFAACPGPVQITIVCRDLVQAGQPALRIVVQDNGPGLNEEQKQRIFEPFYTTKTRGTGLGTSIARRIVEAHGGEIAIGDRLPPGAEVVILLPRQG
jgi:PAS domain S-box-containing protein